MRAPVGSTVLVGIAIAVVVVAVVAGLVVLPAPSEERVRRLDERRVQDLRGIARAMDLFLTRHGRLPDSMEALLTESGPEVSVRDPGTGQDYELHVLDAANYELCAGFEQVSAAADGRAGPAPETSDAFWSHGVGRQCFTLEAQEVPARDRRQQ